jgi:hypothetical protein
MCKKGAVPEHQCRASINAEHQFYVIQTEFISPEKTNFTSVSKNNTPLIPLTLVFLQTGLSDF